MSVDLQDQYDKIFRYCYYKVHDRELAEDLTQETFLRFLEKPRYHSENKDLQYLYTIAGNLCVDTYRKKSAEPLMDNISDGTDFEDELLTNTVLSNAIRKLSEEERELILLRYVNEIPMGVLSALYGVSRFKLSRRIRKILNALRKEFDG